MNIKRKIGKNRDKARIWIEGTALAAAGWNKGTKFDSLFGNGKIEYVLAPLHGKRAVAGDPARPIIDTNTDKILDSLGASVGDTVNIEITPDSITISKEAA